MSGRPASGARKALEKFQEQPVRSYAQNQEDVVLARALEPSGRKGFWIDVGAFDPIVDSVTALFSEMGWSGINIEPLADEFQRFQDLRPRDINLNTAVSNYEGSTVIYAGPPENRGMSTLDQNLGESYEDAGFTPVVTEVTTLAKIVEQYVNGPVDFLKIDVEGLEQLVLEGADWKKCRPRIVVVEATLPGSLDQSFEDWEQILSSNDYSFALDDGINRFYYSNSDPEADELRKRLSKPANPVDHFITHQHASLGYELRMTKQQMEDLAVQQERLRVALHVSQQRCAIALDELAAIRSSKTFRFALKVRSLVVKIPGVRTCMRLLRAARR